LSKANQVILLGEQLAAAQALAAGLVCTHFKEGMVLKCTLEAISPLLAKNPVAVALAKEAVSRGERVAASMTWAC
jgi:enoyl-CoA hydratase/carnithine racemase